MSEVRFELGFSSRELQTLDLPIEIRTPSLALVRRVLVSERAELEPGTYHVFARFPAGQEIHREIAIEAGQERALVRLEPEQADVPAEAFQQIRRYLGSGAPLWTHESTDPGDWPFDVRWFEGNLLEGSCRPAQDLVITGDARKELTIDGGSSATTRYVQLSQPGEAAVNVALPVGSAGSCRVSFPRPPGDRIHVEIHLRHPTADLLAQYLRRGLFDEATVTMRSESLCVDRLLPPPGAGTGSGREGHTDQPDPVAAAIRAYAILRLGQPALLRDWTARLLDEFPWLPDGVAIHAELLARSGEHEEALELLLRLPERGLPVFSDGLSYAIDRLAVYAGDGADLDSKQQATAAELLVTLRRFAAFTDFGQPLIHYTGQDPNRPDAKQADAYRFAPLEDQLFPPLLTCAQLLAPGGSRSRDLMASLQVDPQVAHERAKARALPSELLEVLRKAPETSVSDAIIKWVDNPLGVVKAQLTRVARLHLPHHDSSEVDSVVAGAVLDVIDHVELGKPILTSLQAFLTGLTKGRAICLARVPRPSAPAAKRPDIRDERQRAIARLDPVHRLVIELMYLEGLSRIQAAERLGISLEQLEMDHERAKRLLNIAESA
jgi:hypothetical protein